MVMPACSILATVQLHWADWLIIAAYCVGALVVGLV